MPKITITRLPNATPEYSPTQTDQLMRLLEQIILLLNTSYADNIEEQGNGRSWFLVRILHFNKISHSYSIKLYHTITPELK